MDPKLLGFTEQPELYTCVHAHTNAIEGLRVGFQLYILLNKDIIKHQEKSTLFFMSPE